MARNYLFSHNRHCEPVSAASKAKQSRKILIDENNYHYDRTNKTTRYLDISGFNPWIASQARNDGSQLMNLSHRENIL